MKLNQFQLGKTVGICMIPFGLYIIPGVLDYMISEDEGFVGAKLEHTFLTQFIYLFLIFTSVCILSFFVNLFSAVLEKIFLRNENLRFLLSSLLVVLIARMSLVPWGYEIPSVEELKFDFFIFLAIYFISKGWKKFLV